MIARNSAFKLAEEEIGVRAIGKELGARYLLEGSLRKAGSTVRLSVQLVDTLTATHLWAETFDREFDPGAVFDLLDDLVPRIVSTVADMHGFLPRSMSEEVGKKSPGQLSPYEAVLSTFAYFEKLTSEELKKVRTALNLAVEKEPLYADAWAMLALIEVQQYSQEPGEDRGPVRSAIDAARKAVESVDTLR